MTTPIDEILIRIEGEQADLRRELTRAGRSLEKFERQAKKSLKRVDSAFGQLRVAAASLGLGILLRRAFSGAKDETIAFSKALAELSAITGATGRDLKFLENAARDAQATSTKSAVAFIQAAKLIASAKPELLENAKALAAITKEAVILSEASGLELPSAANALTTALNQFSEPAEEAGRFINVMAAGAKFGAAEIPDLTQALQKSGTIAAEANIPFEELVATIELLAQFKEPTERMATSLRNVLIILQTGADATNPKVVGLTQALKNLAAQNLTTAQTEKLFGRENIVVAQQLVKVKDALREMTVKVTGTGIAFEQAVTSTAELAGATERLDNAWREFNVTLGKSGGLLEWYISMQSKAVKGATFALDLFRDIENRQTRTVLGTLALGRQRAFGANDPTRVRDIQELAARGVEIPVSFLFPGEQELVASTKARFFPDGPLELPAKIKEIPISPRRDPGGLLVGNLAGKDPRSAKGPRDLLPDREAAQQALKDIEVAFLRATGRMEEAVNKLRDAEIDALEKRMDDGLISEEQFQSARLQIIETASARVKEIGKNEFDELQASIESFSRSGAQEIADMVLDMELSFDKLGKAIARMFLQIAANRFITKPLEGLFNSVLGSVLGGRAGGGKVQAGVPYEINERGRTREIFVPDTTGTIRNGQDSRRMGGRSIIVNIEQSNNFAGGAATQQDVVQLAAVTHNAAIQGTFEEMERRGML